MPVPPEAAHVRLSAGVTSTVPSIVKSTASVVPMPIRLAPDPKPTSRQTIPVVPLTSLIGELLIVVENVAAAGVSVEDVTNVPPVSVKFTPPSLL